MIVATNPLDFQPGDLLFFAGADLTGRAIAWKTCTWRQWFLGQRFSHVGVCAEYHPPRGGGKRTLLFESTTLTDMPCIVQERTVQGPQVHDPRDRIAGYRGKAWRLRLQDPLTTYERKRLTDYSLSVLGDGYDWRGAAAAGTWFLRLDTDIAPNPAALFCSRYAVHQMQACNRMSPSDAPGEFSPARLARELIHRETVWPISEIKTLSCRLK